MFSKSLTFFLFVIFLLGCDQQTPSREVPPTIKKIATAYGIDNFHEIEILQFTFNVAVGEKKVKRSWEWEPKTGKVTYQDNLNGKDGKYTYNSKNVKNDEKEKKIDAQFINDHYWLIFPFRLLWDTGFSHKIELQKELPISSGKSDCLIISYNNKDGYTPGDVYEFYYDKDYIIQQWVYCKAGSEKPSLTTTWEQNQKLGNITISLEHQNEDKSFRLWFSDVKAKINGEWVGPK